MRPLLVIFGLLAVTHARAGTKAVGVREARDVVRAFARAKSLPQLRAALRKGPILIAVQAPTQDDVVKGQIQSAMSGRWASGGERRSLAFELLGGRVEVVDRRQTLRLNGRPPTSFIGVDDLVRHAVPGGTPILRKEGFNPSGWEFQWTPEVATIRWIPRQPAQRSSSTDPIRAQEELFKSPEFEATLNLAYDWGKNVTSATIADAIERSR